MHLALVFLAALVTVVVTLTDGESGGCGEVKKDLAILLDASGSVGVDNFQLAKDFVRDLLLQLSIGPAAMQVALLTFATETKVFCWLEDSLSRDAVLVKLNNITYDQRATLTHVALQTVHDQVLTARRGARPGVADMVVVITDGRSNIPARTLDEVQRLHQSGVAMVAIGVGAGVDENEIRAMASRLQLAFLVESYSDLGSLHRQLFLSACDDTPPSDEAKADSTVASATTETISDTTTTAATETTTPTTLTTTNTTPPTTIVTTTETTTRRTTPTTEPTTTSTTTETTTETTTPTTTPTTTSTPTTTETTTETTTPSTTSMPTTSETTIETTTPTTTLTTTPTTTATTTSTPTTIETTAETTTRTTTPTTTSTHTTVQITTETIRPPTAEATTTTTTTKEPSTKATIETSTLTTTLATTPTPKEATTDTVTTKTTTAATTETISATTTTITTTTTAMLTTTTLPDALTTEEATSGECGAMKKDLVILVDASASVGERDFQLAKNFVRDLLLQLSIGPDAVQVALLTFATEAKVFCWLEDSLSRDAVLVKLNNVTYDQRATLTHVALQTVHDQVLTAQRGARPGVANMVVVITDGRSNVPARTLDTVQRLHQSGVAVVAIGVGAGVDQTEISAMASRPQLAFLVESYSDLGSLHRQLFLSACDESLTGNESLLTESASYLTSATESSDEGTSSEALRTTSTEKSAAASGASSTTPDPTTLETSTSSPVTTPLGTSTASTSNAKTTVATAKRTPTTTSKPTKAGFGKAGLLLELKMGAGEVRHNLALVAGVSAATTAVAALATFLLAGAARRRQERRRIVKHADGQNGSVV